MKASKTTLPKNYSSEIATALSLLGVVGRLIPHPANVTPVGGLAIWGGMRLDRKMSLAVVIGTMFISDFFLGFHATMAYTYGAMILITVLASLVTKTRWWSVAGMTIAGSLLFYLITNFGVWQATPLYVHTWQGLMQSYVAGLPFLRNSMAGDILYVSVFFGLDYAVSLAAKKKPVQASLSN